MPLDAAAPALLTNQALHAALFLFLCLVILLFAKKRGFFVLEQSAPVSLRLSLPNVGIALLCYLIPGVLFLVAGLFFNTTIFSMLSENTIIAQSRAAFASALLSVILLLTYYFCLDARLREQIFGVKAFLQHNFRRAFVIGMLSWFIIYPFVLFTDEILQMFNLMVFHMQELPDQVVILIFRESLASSASYIPMIIAIVVIAPIAEELFFRGFLHTFLRSRIGVKAALLVSASLFAAIHFAPAQKLGNITLIGALFVLGWFLGFLFEKNKSLFAPIGLHMTFNALSLCNLVIFGDY